MNLCDSTRVPALTTLLARYGLTLARLAPGAAIPGSYWGEPEAGLIKTVIHVRADTPLHSALHEAAHVICMDDRRRAHLHTDAGGDYAEEDAVCYLQIVLAQEIGLSREQICADMDAWGYTFRLGSALAWFTQDAEDARRWLIRQRLLTPAGEATGRAGAVVGTAGPDQVRLAL
ncbi:MAG: hypothetical protein AAB329_05745 [Pseudomonadota bacterium]